jgi:hypothetical protein
MANSLRRGSVIYEGDWPGAVADKPATATAQPGVTIGDELQAANLDWGWYSGGWSNGNGDA